MKLKDADCISCEHLDALSIDTLRGLFRSYRKVMRYAMSLEDIERALEAVAPVTPAEWVDAMRKVTCECERCRGTGTYSWGACINGKMEHSGMCYRCGGKGLLNNMDARRCYGYDNYAIVAACR